MAEIINLRLVRKVQRRAKAEQQAATNRAKFGQAKGVTLRQRQEAGRQERQLDGAKREQD
jgi:hypothetical protein